MKIKKEILRDNTQEKILSIVLESAGVIKFIKALYPRSYNIAKVRAVVFTQDISDEFLNDPIKWNAYVDSIYKAIGVHSYCVWVRDIQGNMIGILAFYDTAGEEIKMKHFKKWEDLLKKLK